MAGVTRQIRRRSVLTAMLLCSLAGVAAAQTGPVAKMYASDQKRAASRAQSVLIVALPAKTGVPPAQVYLSAGDLERAFDSPEFRPDAVIIPTNTELDLASSDPATQRVLVSRVQKQTEVMRDLEA